MVSGLVLAERRAAVRPYGCTDGTTVGVCRILSVVRFLSFKYAAILVYIRFFRHLLCYRRDCGG